MVAEILDDLSDLDFSGFNLYGTGVAPPAPPPPPPLSEQELADLGITEDFTFDLDLSDIGRFSLF
jgi:hypothetical protein